MQIECHHSLILDYLSLYLHTQATATATITITDVNDNAPQLVGNFFDVTINESNGNTLSPSNEVIITGLGATDVDLNTQFTYSIVDTAKTNGWFQVDEDNVRLINKHA